MKSTTNIRDDFVSKDCSLKVIQAIEIEAPSIDQSHDNQFASEIVDQEHIRREELMHA